MESNTQAGGPQNLPNIADEGVQRPKQDDGSQYMRGMPLVLLTVALTSVSFILGLDNTILATAIPQITSDFNSLNDIGWYGSSYLIAQMSLLPVCGQLYTFFNSKWAYSVSLVVVFELGCVISAVAPNLMTLIIGRAVSGVGAAGLISGSTIVTSYCVAPKERALLLAIVLGIYGIGSALGPLVGGAITDNKTLTWRFVFWVNLPFGAVGLAMICLTLRKPPTAEKSGLPWAQKLRQLEVVGAGTLLGSIVCLNLALQWGGIVYSWSNAKVFGCLIGFGTLLAAFIYLQAQSQGSSTIPLRIFRNRTICVSCCFMMFCQLAIDLQTYYWPIYFQSVKDSSAKDSELYLLPIIISNSMCNLYAGWIVSRFGHYVPLMWIGAPMLAAGGGLFRFVYPGSPKATWIGFQVLSGAGYGLCGQMPIMAVQVVLAKSDVPTGIVVVMLFQLLGGALAPAVGQSLLVDRLLRSLGGLPGVDGPAIVNAGAREFRNTISSDILVAVIDAYNFALRNVSWMALAAPLVAWAVIWGME